MKNLVNFSILSILVLTFFSCSSVDIPEIPQNIASTSSSSGDSNSSAISSSSSVSSSSDASSSSSDALSSSSDASSSSGDEPSSSSETSSSSGEEVVGVKIWDGTADTTWYTNNKSASSFIITTAEQLAGLAKLVDGVSGANGNGSYTMSGQTIILGKNIMLNDTTNWRKWGTLAPGRRWTPIGKDDNNAFRGIFYGGDFVISGVYISSSSTYQGLFGYLYNGIIRNLGVNASYINNNSTYTGGLVGYARSSEISDSYFVGIVRGINYVGGLVGYQNITPSTIDKSYFTGNVHVSGTGEYRVGGLVGYQNIGTISRSYFNGDITCENTNPSTNNIGGLVGYKSIAGVINNSYAIGTIEGMNSSKVGRLVGEIGTASVGSAGNISNTYSVVKLFVSTLCDGLLGIAYNGNQITSSYYDNEISTNCSSTSNTGEGESTDKMKTEATFENWNFSSYWGIDSNINNGYPYLRANPPRD